jgi:hypothetical protein
MATAQSKYSLAPIQSSYVDPGTVQVASILRQRYDENKSKYDMINRAAKNLEVGTGDQHHKDAALQGIQDGIEGTLRRGTFDMAGGDIDELATSFATNESLSLATQSYQNHLRDEEVKAQLRANGKQHLDFGEIHDENGNLVGHKFDNHQSYWTDEAGVVHKDIYQGGTEQQLGYSEKMKQLIGTIAKDPIGLRRLEDGLKGFLFYGEGVSERKADKVAAGLYDAYLATNEGTQQMRKLTQLDGLTEEEARNFMVGTLQSLAREQVGHTERYMEDPYAIAGVENPRDGVFTYQHSASEVGSAYENYKNTLTTQVDALNSAVESGDEEAIAAARTAVMTTEYNMQQSKNDNIAKSGDQALIDANKTRQSLLSGEFEKYSALDGFLMELTKQTWTPDMFSDAPLNPGASENEAGWWAGGVGGAVVGGSQGVVLGSAVLPGYGSILGGVGGAIGGFLTGSKLFGTNSKFGNVRDFWAGEDRERENLKVMLNDIETLNTTFGLELTQADVPKIQELGDNYYTLMTEQGGDALVERFENMEIAADQMMAFSSSNAKGYNAVMSTIKQQPMSSYNILGADGLPLGASQIEELQADIGVTTDDGEPKVAFGGISIGTSADTGKMILHWNGHPYTVSSKRISQMSGNDVLSMVAREMGYGEDYRIQQQYAADIEAGDVSIAQHLGMRSNEYQFPQLAELYPTWENALTNGENKYDEWLKENAKPGHEVFLAQSYFNWHNYLNAFDSGLSAHLGIPRSTVQTLREGVEKGEREGDIYKYATEEEVKRYNAAKESFYATTLTADYFN